MFGNLFYVGTDRLKNQDHIINEVCCHFIFTIYALIKKLSIFAIS